MAPHWVRTLDDYWVWINRTVENSGGQLVFGQQVEADLIEGADGKVVGLRVPSHALAFAAGSILNFSMVVGEDLTEVDYSFNNRDSAGRLMWRACRNDHYLNILETDYHVHLPGEFEAEAVLPHKHIDLEDAIEAIHAGNIPGSKIRP